MRQAETDDGLEGHARYLLGSRGSGPWARELSDYTCYQVVKIFGGTRPKTEGRSTGAAH